MAFVETVSEEEATGAAAELYEADRERLGYVANYTRAFAGRLDAFRAWGELNRIIKDGMDRRRYELATVAAARRLRSSYCSLAHGKALAKLLGADAVRDLALDRESAGLDAVDVGVMDLAEKVVDDAASVTQADVDRLRELGLSDDDVVGVVLAAAARSFFSKTLDALGVQPDAAFAELDPGLRDALTVGRPIAAP